MQIGTSESRQFPYARSPRPFSHGNRHLFTAQVAFPVQRCIEVSCRVSTDEELVVFLYRADTCRTQEYFVRSRASPPCVDANEIERGDLRNRKSTILVISSCEYRLVRDVVDH